MFMTNIFIVYEWNYYLHMKKQKETAGAADTEIESSKDVQVIFLFFSCSESSEIDYIML